MGTINPLGNSVNSFFTNLSHGVSGAAPITRFDTERFKTKFACQIKDYDWEKYFDRKEVRKYDLFSQYALVASREAIADAAINKESVDFQRVGVIWGSGIGGLNSLFNEVSDLAKNDSARYSPFFILRMISDIAAGHISLENGFMGPNYCTVSACSSSTHAIIAATDQIRLGRAEMMITGGSEAPITEPGVGGFNSMQALSVRNDDPQTASRPYDSDRDGFVIGEGAGALVIEELEHALKRGAKIYAEIAGSGVSADAYHITSPHIEGTGAALSMSMALEESGLRTDEIDYINTHGTSTPAGDIPELKGIKTVFGEDAYRCNISSTKSMTGHLLGAAGAVEALACIMAIRDGLIPPTINCQSVDPEIDPHLNLTLGQAQRRKVRAALSNTFGFGGHNATIILKQYE